MATHPIVCRSLVIYNLCFLLLLSIIQEGQAVAQLFEALRYKTESLWVRFPVVSLEFFH